MILSATPSRPVIFSTAEVTLSARSPPKFTISISVCAAAGPPLASATVKSTSVVPEFLAMISKACAALLTSFAAKALSKSAISTESGCTPAPLPVSL